MNKAQFTSTSVESGGNGKYPLSTQTLAFLQSQIELLQTLSRIGGTRYILQEPENGRPGIVVIDGEVLPLASEPQNGAAIKVIEERVDVTADGSVYAEARILRSAKYVAEEYPVNNETLYRVSDFGNFATNVGLYSKLQELENVCRGVADRLFVKSGVYTQQTLDAQKTNMRLHCEQGSVILNGATNYTLNVYRNGDKCTQEQILMDMRRYKREYDFNTGKWGDFTVVSQNLNIEVRVSNKSNVEVRHGELPSGAKLILLRKKRRSKKRRSGGQNTINPKFEGTVITRPPKNTYAHYREVVLSTGKAGEWYTPVCVSCEMYGGLVGADLERIGLNMIVRTNNGKYEGSYRVRGTSKRVSSRASIEGTTAEGYAKIGLQLITDTPNRRERGDMVRMKYRVWWETTNPSTSSRSLRRSFSVE